LRQEPPLIAAGSGQVSSGGHCSMAKWFWWIRSFIFFLFDGLQKVKISVKWIEFWICICVLSKMRIDRYRAMQLKMHGFGKQYTRLAPCVHFISFHLIWFDFASFAY
jgi:hypothetical protein